ncbi:glutamate--cysteine ligase [Halioxenophilus aromaticivorans]|uniref:Glutamate--cysteine ligase n=1 Tax=Halioxenophilus aromaticivorans TaxID=1306992 RepID=A0AAV3U5V9_9ALTE
MADLHELINSLKETANAALISGMMRGVEKESLRVGGDGALALTEHPRALGSALTHSQITTDFSEALLEFITPPSHQVDIVLDQLRAVHQFTYSNLQQEILWPASMPCKLPEDDQIPVGQYGDSNGGRMKTIYRLGLGQRYGRKMQTIAGIHYNFSLPSPFWAYLHARDRSSKDMQQYRTERYFDLIRNFRRYYWLLIYLFGASPAVCGCFVKGRDHKLEAWDETGRTLYHPYATSLRMGDLGYQSDAQKSLHIDYNKLDYYLHTLCAAIKTSYPPYAEIGLFDKTGYAQQLNTSLLQIENEFYSPIRPKRTARPGETALTALYYRGIEYIEVRCLDLNPYEPLGIGRDEMLFLDTFLLYCCLQDSPHTYEKEYRAMQENQKRTVYQGRNPEVRLIKGDDEPLLKDWGLELMDKMAPIAELLDSVSNEQGHSNALQRFTQYLHDPSLTPSGRLLNDMREQNVGFFELVDSLAQQHARHFADLPVDEQEFEAFKTAAVTSLQKQEQIEEQDNASFEEYLQHYYDQYDFCAKAQL